MISLSVDLAHQPVVVVGGGKVASKRVRLLQEEKARVTVVSPTVTNELKQRVEAGEIRWFNRSFEASDVRDVFLLVIATDDGDTNDSIARLANGVPLVNRADGGTGGNLQIPAQLSRGKLNLSVTTQGASPKLASRLREEWEKQFPPAYEEYVDFLYECRHMLKASPLSGTEKDHYLERMLDPSYLEQEKRWVMKDEIHNKGGGTICQD